MGRSPKVFVKFPDHIFTGHIHKCYETNYKWGEGYLLHTNSLLASPWTVCFTYNATFMELYGNILTEKIGTDMISVTNKQYIVSMINLTSTKWSSTSPTCSWASRWSATCIEQPRRNDDHFHHMIKIWMIVNINAKPLEQDTIIVVMITCMCT